MSDAALARIDEQIDYHFRAKWSRQKAVSYQHADQYGVRYAIATLGSLKPGTVVYSGRSQAYGRVQVGLFPDEVQIDRGELGGELERQLADCEALILTYSKDPCACEVCREYREREAFLASGLFVPPKTREQLREIAKADRRNRRRNSTSGSCEESEDQE